MRMGSQLILTIIITALPVLVLGNTFWQLEPDCRSVKQTLNRRQRNVEERQVLVCIVSCFRETTRGANTSPEECFNTLMVPYITVILNRRIPSQTDMSKCLETKDRSNCRNILLYFFTKLYKEKYDPAHYHRYAKFLFNSWANNPDIPRPITFSKYEWSLATELTYLKFDSDHAIEAAKKVTSVSDPEQFPSIHNELQRYCYKPITDETKDFCKLRIVMNIAKKILTLANKKNEYLQDLEKYTSAIKFNFVALSALYGHDEANKIQPRAEEQKAILFDQKLNELADLGKARDTKKLLDFLQFMPEPHLLNQACQQTTFPRIARRSCILVEVQEQLMIYSKMAEKRKSSSGKKAIAINFSLNMRGIITELRGEEIFKMLLDQRYDTVSQHEETINLIEGKFVQLQGYFTKLQSFNMQKASADVAYVKGMIDYYEKKVGTALDAVGESVGAVLNGAVAAQGLEVAHNGVKLAFAIAEACNPFKVVFNGGTATGIMDALSELMTSISRLVEAVAMVREWENVAAMVTKISEDLKKNSEFLASVGKIVSKIKLEDFPGDEEFEESKSTFLRLYNAYSPEVDAEELALLGSKLDTAVSVGCDLIDSAETSAGAGYVAYVKDNLYCPKAKDAIASMTAIYEEIYNFQFELIESMAEYLKSSTGYHAAQKMVRLAGEPMAPAQSDDLRNDLRANVIMAHTTYEMQKEGAIQSLCDFLQYKEGGVTPTVCKASPINVPTLLSYIPKRCTSINKYVSIPISTSANPEIGHINITALYAGEEVLFNITSYDWLKENNWIDSDENVEAVYVRSFHIFLPTVTAGRSGIRITVKSVGGNKFVTDGTRYSLIPIEAYRLDYTEGKRFYPCSGNKIENPYSICEDKKLPKICVMSDTPTYDDAQRLYPSILSRFKIKAKGVTADQTPDPTTKLDIKAKINMCIFVNGIARKKRQSQERRAGCCEENTYWNEGNSGCESCSSGSRSNLNGYYCEKNLNALGRVRRKSSSSKDNKSV